MTRETEDATERDRRRYQRELSQRLSGQAEVSLTLTAEVTMACVRRPASGG